VTTYQSAVKDFTDFLETGTLQSSVKKVYEKQAQQIHGKRANGA
jgi:hypothetical protein